MALRAITGDPTYWNLLSRGLTAPTVSPAEDALYPASNLRLNSPQKPFRFGSFGGISKVTVDTAIVSSGFETYPDGWTASGSGTDAQSAVQKHAGSFSAKLTCGAGAGLIRVLYRDFVARAGETIHVDLWSFGDGTNPGSWRLDNITTGHGWTGAAWSTPTAIAVSATAAWTNTTADITLESYQSVRSDTFTLRLILTSPTVASAFTYFDDVLVWPFADVCALIGHTVTAIDVIQWRGSTDNFVGSDVLITGMSNTRQAIYGLAGSAQSYRYYRLNMSHTNVTVTTSNTFAPFLGAVAMGLTQTYTAFPLPQWTVTRRMPQQRNETRGRTIRGRNLGAWPARDVQLDFQLSTAAKADELRMDLIGRSGYGSYPALVIPHDSQPHVLWCRPSAEWSEDQTFATTSGAQFRASVTLQEEGYFTPTA